jgi:serine/threonine-protein kinase
MLEWALGGRHLAYVGIGFTRLMQAAEGALMRGSLLAAYYLALEPVVRSKCPHRLTAWTRLLAGRWRDPLVGRDVLLGVVTGLLVTADLSLNSLAVGWDGPGVVDPVAFTAPARTLLDSAELSIQITWYYAAIGAVVLAVTGRDWVAIAIQTTAVAVLLVPWSGGDTRQMVMDLVRILAAAALFARLGILAVAAWFVSYLVVVRCPLTLDPTAWYFGASLTYMAVVVGLAGYGAAVSVGARRQNRGPD